MTQLAVEPDPKEGVYRLERFDVEVRGRRREFVRSLLLFVVLFLLQQPLRREALSGGTPYLDPVVSLRISLILDVAFMISYVLIAYRAWGLVRAFRAPRRLAAIARAMAYVGISIVVVVDVAEDIYLWRTYTGDDLVTSLAWGPSQLILVVGLAIALGVNVVLALVTDPRLYWRRRGDSLIRRHWVPTRRPGWLSRDDIARWKGVLSPRLDDGSCSCGVTTIPAPDPGVERGWGVICCSGGGVRSAAFSLGGLQALNKAKLYEKTDAVIGVSGGGYTSTAYHVMRWQSGDTAEDFNRDKVWTLPIRSTFTPQSPELHWLRRHTHYVLDSVRVAIHGGVTLAFGIAINLVLLAVAIGATAWVLAWVYLASGAITLPKPTFTGLDDEASRIHLDVGGTWWSLQHIWWVPLAGILLFLLERAWDRFQTVSYRWRIFLRYTGTGLVIVGAALCLVFIGLPALITALFDFADTSGSASARLIYSLGIVPQEHCEAVIKAPGAVAACGQENKPEAGTPGIAAASIVTIVTSILAVLASVKAASKSSSDGSGAGGLLKKIWSKIKDPVVPWLAVTLIVLVCLVQLVRWTSVLTTQPDRLDNWRYAQYAAIVLLLLKLLSEPNRTSLHHFFRERIAYAFLVRRRFRQVEPLPYKEPLRFSQSRPPPSKGPRLVTCAVANASDPALVPSQRGCTPFVFDDQAIGLTDRLLPQEAARRISSTYEFAADYGYRDATIPAAVAMSAAAFSPLAGRENVRLGPYRAVLALGNARLGVWMPNPLWVDAGKLARRQATLRNEDFAETWSTLSCQDAADLWPKLGAAQGWASRVCTDAAPRVPRRHEGLWLEARDGQTSQSWWTKSLDAISKAVDTAGRETDERGPWWAKPLEMSRTVMKKPGMTRVVREAVGQASIYDRFLYVTDGGHYDNLGLIEALRRKPRRIFAIDASNDAEDTFRTIGLAVATARMDLDCELKMDPRPMRRLKEQRSAAGWCTGTAKFPDGTSCAIYLVKAVMLDNMPWDVETYAASNLDFPRTSTGKQLYSEFDFEAYRMLGVRAIEELLRSLPYQELEDAVASKEAADERAAEQIRIAAAITLPS